MWTVERVVHIGKRPAETYRLVTDGPESGTPA